MDAIAAFAKGARMTSPDRSWGSHRSAFEAKPLGRTNVHATPEERTASSDVIHIWTMALPGSPPTMDRDDKRTTCSTPALRISANTPGMSRYPPKRNTLRTDRSEDASDSGRSRSPATTSTLGGSVVL